MRYWALAPQLGRWAEQSRAAELSAPRSTQERVVKRAEYTVSTQAAQMAATSKLSVAAVDSEIAAALRRAEEYKAKGMSRMAQREIALAGAWEDVASAMEHLQDERESLWEEW